ncbi:pirin family protein [Alphaproteobacteria bacterium]|nr:pirin family protein [Alphaproteobacteria bacterium]MDC1023257.1 pirin family protein [Alphaproteobacteria bacterium]
MSIRPILNNKISSPVIEGAGVRLDRAFGFSNTSQFDPFLLLDDFRNNNPDDYLKGFPWHPHRGIETITYILKGSVEHKDSLGNSGKLSDGDIQWMTAGSGILHQEMPLGNNKGEMHGFQLWANLPSNLKMINPNYQDVKSEEIKVIKDDDGTIIKIIIGNYKGYKGIIKGIASDPQYFDICIPPNKIKSFEIPTYNNCFAYVFEGNAKFDYSSKPQGIKIEKTINDDEYTIRDMSGNKTLITFDTGKEINLLSGNHGVRFLLISGAPIQEPVAWHGPIVMNTDKEIKQAMYELNNGTFIKQ